MPCKFNCGVNGNITCIYTEKKTIKTYVGSSGGINFGGLRQIPSNYTDYSGNNPNIIQVHVTSAKKDIIGVTGEIMNKGNDTLNSVLVTVHFYDSSGNLVADTACCYTTPTDRDPGHTATFDSFAMSNQISGKPVSFRLSYDWSAPTPSVNQAPSQSASNFTGGNITSAAKSSSSSLLSLAAQVVNLRDFELMTWPSNNCIYTDPL
jgi:hypothetical protein